MDLWIVRRAARAGELAPERRADRLPGCRFAGPGRPARPLSPSGECRPPVTALGVAVFAKRTTEELITPRAATGEMVGLG
jgi:hypothetical protein